MISSYKYQNSDNANYDSYNFYFIGFILSIILTTLPFIMVMQISASKNILVTMIVICAVLQIAIHLICLLRINESFGQQWSLIVFLFTIMIITILLVGSLWIMWHLNYNLNS